jgi:hypothetical protein
MDINAGLDGMRDGLRTREWAQVEAAAGAVCANLDRGGFDRIAALDLRPYQDELATVLRGVADSASSSDATAVYWEFDLDNGWDSAFFLCDDYAPEEDGDDSWASVYDEDNVVSGPSQSDLAAIYPRSFNATDSEVARNLFLIARTVVAFGQAASEVWPDELPLCAGFHDQESLFRIVEPE